MVVRFVQGQWDAPSGSFGVAWFIVVRTGCRRVPSGSLSSVGCALRGVGFVRGRCVLCVASSGSFGISWVRPGVRRVPSGSLGLV